MKDMLEAPPETASSATMAQAVSASELIAKLNERCRKAWQGGGSAFPPALGWIKLDAFMDQRGELGFSGLEQLMKSIHERCRMQLDTGDLSAHFGLDAIAVILDPAGGDRDLQRTARDVIKAISSDLFEIGELSIAATVSMAIRPVREALKPAEANLVRAATAAESISEQGGNRFELGYHEISEGDAPGALLGQLTRAIRDNKVRVVSQPFMSTTNPARERYQLFPRLVAADGSLIPAARFVPIAAKRGALPALDHWMFRFAVDLLHEKVKDGLELPHLFLSQSTALIEDSRMLSQLREKLQELEPEQRSLVLEFSILDLKPRIREARRTFMKLKELGIRISISGIDEKVPDAVLLRHLPADYLKMKANFAQRVLEDEALCTRFNNFADQARKAGRQVVVPMLEDAESVSRFWQMNVDLIQGNFIHQPSEQALRA